MSQSNAFRLLMATTLLCAPCLSISATSAKPLPVVDQVVAALCNKGIAVLGELPSHGEGRAFRIKADVVAQLVQRCGFDAILFEAPIYDFLGLEAHWGKRSATTKQLDDAIGRFWLSTGLLDWRLWIFREADAGRLVVGGLDDQVSVTSEHARAVLPGLIASRVTADKAEACRTVVDRNLRWSYDADHPFDDAEKILLHECARSAVDGSSKAAFHNPVAADELMALNFASYVERQVHPESAPNRDEIMFQNALWHFDRLPMGAKVIIWTATVHGARQQGSLKSVPLGAKFHQRFGSEFGTVGFTAFGGQTAMAGNPAKTLVPAPPGSLEARTVSLSGDEFYLDKNALAQLGEVESRLFGRLTRSDWSGQFDGVAVIRDEQAANFNASD